MADLVDLRQTYPMHQRASSFTVTSSFHHHEQTKLQIRVEPDESLEVEMLASTVLDAKDKHVTANASSLSPLVVDQTTTTTTTTKSSDPSVKQQKAQIGASSVGFGVAMRRTRSLPVQRSSYKGAVASMEAMRNRLDVPTSNDDTSTASTQDSAAASTTEHSPPSPTASARDEVAVPIPNRLGPGRLLGRKPRSYQMYMQSMTETSHDDASTVNTSKKSEPSRKPYQLYKQSSLLSNNSEDGAEALAAALEVQRKKEEFLQSPPPKVVKVSPPRPEVRVPRKARTTYGLYQQSIATSEDESDVLAHVLEVQRKKEEFLSAPTLSVAAKSPSSKKKTTYSLYQQSLSLSGPTDELAVVSAVMDAERRKKEFLMRPVVRRSPPRPPRPPPVVQRISKNTMLSPASSMSEDHTPNKTNVLSPLTSTSDDHTPVKTNTLSPATLMSDDHNSTMSKSRFSRSDEPLPVLPVLTADDYEAPAINFQPLDKPLCETEGVEAVIETGTEAYPTSVLLQESFGFKETTSVPLPSRDASAQPQRWLQEHKRVSPPPPTMRPTSTSPPPPTKRPAPLRPPTGRPASQMFTRRPLSPPPVTSVTSRLSVLVAVDSIELEKRERSQQRDRSRDAKKAEAGRGNRYQMPLHVLSDDVEEAYSGSDASESCSTSCRDLSFNSSQSYSTMAEESNYLSYDEDSTRRGEYTDGEDPTYGEEPTYGASTFDRAATPSRYFTSSFDNSTLESGTYFLNADKTYKMIDFYRLKNRRQRSGEFRSRNPGASWDHSEISDMFSQASHLYESTGVFLGRSASAVSEALWETQDEDDEESQASSAFGPIGTATLQMIRSQSTAGGSAFMSLDRDKARISDLPNNTSLLSSGSQLESSNENGAFTDIDLDVEVEREGLVRRLGWMFLCG